MKHNVKACRTTVVVSHAFNLKDALLGSTKSKKYMLGSQTEWES